MALSDFLVTIWARCRRHHVSSWCAKRQGHWDKVVPGSSALRAATLRKIQIEMDIAEGQNWCLVLWDLRKFYDTIRIAALVRQGTRLKFPPAIMYMAVATYQSPRVLRTKGGACSEWILPHDSVLAGCSMANDMARCAVYDMCEEISNASARAELSQYVDDFTQYATHPSVNFLEPISRLIGLFFSFIL